MSSWPNTNSSSGDSNSWLHGGSDYSDPDEHIYYPIEDGSPRWIRDKAWNGEDEDRLIFCKCHQPAHRYVAFQGSMLGRRFLGCPHKDERRCNFVHWVDGQWSPVLDRSLERLWWLVSQKEDEKEDAVWEGIGKLAEAKAAMEEEIRVIIAQNTQAMTAISAEKEALQKKVEKYEFFVCVAVFAVAAIVMVGMRIL